MERLASVTTGAGTGAVWVPQIWTLINGAWVPTLSKNGEENSPSPTLLGFPWQPDPPQSSWQGRHLRSCSVKVSARKVSGTLIPILQLDDVSSNAARRGSHRGQRIWKKIITRFLMSVEQFKLRSEDFFVGLSKKKCVVLSISVSFIQQVYTGCYCRQCNQSMK